MHAYRQKPELIGFGNRIAEKRTECGMNQEELAVKIGIGRPALSKIEQGAQDMRIETLGRLCRVLNTSADYFLHGASAKNIDIYMRTGLDDSSLDRLAKWKDVDESFGDGKAPPRIDVINELLSEDRFYSLAYHFTAFRREWGLILTEIATVEKAKEGAELYSKEYRQAAKRIEELRERADYLKWRFLREVAAYIDELLDA